MKKKVSHKKRKTHKSSCSKRIERDLSIVKEELLQVINVLQSQNQTIQQTIAAQSQPDPNDPNALFQGMTQEQISNVQQGFAPQWSGGVSPPVPTSSDKPPAPDDPSAVSVDVPVMGNIQASGPVKGSDLDAVKEACTGAGNASNSVYPSRQNQAVRDEFNLRQLIYSPGSKKFFRTYCDALASGESYESLQIVDEGLFKSRLRNKGETGPYAAEELASDLTTAPTEGQKGCATDPLKAPACPPGMTGSNGNCYEAASKSTWTTYVLPEAFLAEDNKFYMHMCPDTVPDAPEGDGSSFDRPLWIYPSVVANKRVWRYKKGYTPPGSDQSGPRGPAPARPGKVKCPAQGSSDVPACPKGWRNVGPPEGNEPGLCWNDDYGAYYSTYTLPGYDDCNNPTATIDNVPMWLRQSGADANLQPRTRTRPRASASPSAIPSLKPTTGPLPSGPVSVRPVMPDYFTTM